MAQNKKSFVVYTSWNTFLEDLNNEQLGTWFRWVLDYTNDLNPPMPEDALTKMACKMVRDVLKRDLKKYENKVESIQKAREIRKNKIENNNEINTDINNEIKNVSNGVNVNVNDNVNVNENLIPLKKKTDFLLNPIIDKVFEIYKEECPNLIKIGYEPKNIKKRELINTYLDETESNLDYFREVCKKANKLKKIGKYQIDFEMLIKYHERIYKDYYANADDTFDYMEYINGKGAE